jgi:two-component system, NtrC family, sensor histidine kinase HydH
MARVPMKTRLVSILAACVAFAVASALGVVILRGLGARNRLESLNDGERTINLLLSSMRNYQDFGAAIEGIPALGEKVVGVSVFGRDGGLLYAWGDAPRSRPGQEFKGTSESGQMEEMYVENPKASSTVILMRPQRPVDAPPDEPPSRGRPRTDRPDGSFMFDIFRSADLISLEIRQPAYWRQRRLLEALLPVVEVLLAALVGSMWLLIMKNAEYRAGAERQKNLVMLGTAAGTLAHEIKNPLLAIRLQTGILARSLPGGAGLRELAIIDDEVNRLSMLSTRINDILRDPTGRPEPVDPLAIVSEVGARLCGRPLVNGPADARPTDLCVRIDPERLRSIVENLLRNALESGGPEDGVSVEVSAAGGQIHVDVLDRGAGIPPRDREKAFDLFFTTKSRGTGIGLAVCRRFAAAAAGTVALEDRPGGGMRARLALPRLGP